METPVIDVPEIVAAPEKAPVTAKKRSSGEPKVDLYAVARHAKKMRRRKAHRAHLKGSHTNG